MPRTPNSSRRTGPVPNTGIGVFAGNALPQDLGAPVTADLMTGTLAGEPALRVARSVASRESRIYSGTAPSPQRFVKQADATQSLSDLHNGSVRTSGRRKVGNRNTGL